MRSSPSGVAVSWVQLSPSGIILPGLHLSAWLGRRRNSGASSAPCVPRAVSARTASTPPARRRRTRPGRPYRACRYGRRDHPTEAGPSRGRCVAGVPGARLVFNDRGHFRTSGHVTAGEDTPDEALAAVQDQPVALPLVLVAEVDPQRSPGQGGAGEFPLLPASSWTEQRLHGPGAAAEQYISAESQATGRTDTASRCARPGRCRSSRRRRSPWRPRDRRARRNTGGG